MQAGSFLCKGGLLCKALQACITATSSLWGASNGTAGPAQRESWLTGSMTPRGAVCARDVESAVRELGLSGRPIEVHVSLRSFGALEKGPATIVEGVLAAGSSAAWACSAARRTSAVPIPNLLEIIVLVRDEGDELIIHAMPLRPAYRRLLKP